MNSMVDISASEQRIAERVDPKIANALAISDRAGGLQFANAGEAMEFAKMLSVSSVGVRKHLRGNPGGCLAIVVQSIEWGLSPFAVANKSYFVNDQIAFESQLIQAVILKRAPIKGRIKFEYSGEGQDRKCRAWARLVDDPDDIVDYQSPKLKDIKVKNSPLWQADPDQQLAYYSGRALCRRHFPDIILGIFEKEELEAQTLGVGADNARDVTPRRLNDRLDALAEMPSREEATPVVRDSAAAEQDPEQAKSESPPAEGDHTAGSEQSPTLSDPKPSPEKITLVRKLRTKAAKGTNALRLAMAGLTDDERAMLTDADHDEIGGAAEEADRNAGAA